MADKEKFMRLLGLSLLVLFVLVFMANRWIKKEYTKSSTINEPSAVSLPIQAVKKQATAQLLMIEEDGPSSAVGGSDPADFDAKKVVPKKIYEIPLADPILVQ